MAHSAEVIAVKGEGARLVRHDTDPCNLARDYIGVVLPHLDAAYNLARWLTRDEQNAQDVVQEAYLRAYQFFDSFHGDNARPWLLTIVRNTYYTWLKQRHDAALHTHKPCRLITISPVVRRVSKCMRTRARSGQPFGNRLPIILPPLHCAAGF